MYLEASIADLQNAMASERLSAESLSQFYLERIAQLDKQGPKLNAIIELNPDALAIARQRDQERQAGKLRGSLHGIPLVIKDNIDSHDQMMTTAGSLALEANLAAQDAFIVKKLREAGAILLGKSNLSEWANFRSSRSSSGWSSRGGQTQNPYVLGRSPCGSSSGSGVAVAANMCSAAIGTETDGSVTCPASVNGLVGLKPSLGLLSRSGIIPIAHSQDTAGPMTRSVKDAAILLSVMAAPDEHDPISTTQAKKINYEASLDATSLQGARLGIVRNLMGYHEAVDAAAEQAFNQLRSLGAELIDISIDSAKTLREAELTVLLYEFKHDLNIYLAKLAEPLPKTLADIIAFNQRNEAKVMPFFKQELLLKAQEKGPLSDPVYREALAQAKQLAQKEGIDKALTDYRLDALISPTGGPAWSIDKLNGDRYLGSSSSLAAVAGYPHITVPSGFIKGLPLGLSFYAEAFSEAKLLSFAYAYEQAFPARKAPEYLLDVTA